jgi:hypothetical protein
VLTPNDELIIFGTGRLAGERTAKSFMLTAPLKQAQEPASGGFTNDARRVVRIELNPPREWLGPEWSYFTNADQLADVPVGEPLVRPPDLNGAGLLGAQLTVLPGQERTLYPLMLTNAGDSDALPAIEFVYVESSRPALCTLIALAPVRRVTSHGGYYFLMPPALAADIVTLPFQLIAVGWFFAFGPGS